MKKKQLAGILITGAVIIAVGVTGVLSNVVKNKVVNKSTGGVGSMMNGLMGETSVTLPMEPFVGVINIVGTIQASGTESLWGDGSEYNHDMYMTYIDQMKNSSLNKGILLYVDSPGGTVYESDELYLKLME